MQLGICPDAASHLQEMKDMLITISNELLDNFNDLSPVRMEKLHQHRFAAYSFVFSCNECRMYRRNG